MNRTDVHGTLRDMWETRPARPHDDRQVAGVAAALARRYDVDPVLVRIGFVAAAFSGVGAALYVAGWIALPDGRADAAVPRRGPRVPLVIGLLIAMVITLGTLFDGDDGGFSGGDLVLPAIAVGALLFLLHRSRGGRGPVDAVGARAATATADAPTTAMGPSLVKEPGAPVPPAWDPLGAAPFAWDLPEPSPLPPPAPQRRRPPVTPVTLGLALLALAVTSVVLLLNDALTLATAPMLFGVLLAVVGCGLLVGSFLRSGRGLIPVALVFSALTWAALAAPLNVEDSAAGWELREAPLTVGQLDPRYSLTAGEIDLDLRGLDLAVAADGDTSPVHTRVELGVGEVVVTVPENADLTLTTAVGIGDAGYGSQQASGPDAGLQANDLGDDELASGRRLVLDIELGAGEVQVRRG